MKYKEQHEKEQESEHPNSSALFKSHAPHMISFPNLSLLLLLLLLLKITLKSESDHKSKNDLTMINCKLDLTICY